MAAGSHVLKIDGYSITSNPPCGVPRFTSCPFHAGGRTWLISYFPKSSQRSNTDCISLFLVLADAADHAGEAVTAQATFSLLDQDQKPVPSYSRTSFVVTLSASRSSFGYERFMRREDLERSGHLVDDCFALRVDVLLVHAAVVMDIVVPVPPSDMHRHIGDLLYSSEGGPPADLEFRVGRDTFPAHRLVLSARSPVFRAELLFDPPPPVKDAGTNVIVIEDMDAPVFRALLTFIYTDALLPEMEDEYSIIRHLLVAADKYGLERLKLICQGRLRSHINASSAATILLLADKCHCPCLKEACFDFLSSSKVLLDVIETEEFLHLAQSVPAVTKELIDNFLTRCLEKATICGWDQEDSQTDGIVTRGQSRLVAGREHSPPPVAVELFDPMEDMGAALAAVSRDFLTLIYTDALRKVVDLKDDEYSYAIAQRLLVEADKHGLERLRLICQDILCHHINTSSAASILSLALEYHCPCLKKACFEFLTSCSKVLFAVIETEDFENVAQRFPHMTKELIANVVARGLEKASTCRWDKDSQVSVIKVHI